MCARAITRLIMRNFFAILCSAAFLSGQIFPVAAIAAGGESHTGGAASLRSAGTSFGSGTRSTGGVPAPSGQLFQEPTFSGLSYQVHILGEVDKPGTYRIAASTRLWEAITQAGGISGQGSERRVIIQHSEGTKSEVDLLAFKYHGKLDQNPYLLDNDVVFVPLRQNLVQVAGTVKRPGSYELRQEKTLEDLIKLAGGFTAGAALTSPIKIVRFHNGLKEVLEVGNNKDEIKKFLLADADVVVIPHILTKDKKFDYNLASFPGDNGLFYASFEERVFLIGGLSNPGAYPYSPYYSVRQYLTLAGGVTRLGRIKKMKLLTSEGETFRATPETTINPGDTIIVPERYMPPENFVSLILGITTAILSISTTAITLTR